MEFDATYNPLRDELLREPLQVENGFMTPPEGPGLGVEVDPEPLAKFTFSGPEEMALRQGTLKAS